MYDTSAKNTPIPSFLRIVTFVECVVVAAAIVLFFFPAVGQVAWAFFGMNLLCGAAGLGLILSSRK